MKTVKLFFSSSVVEFKTLRLELSAYFIKLNRFFKKHDIHLVPFFFEDYDSSVSKNRRHEEYNKALRASRYFYIIVGKKVGKWTVENFEEAYKSLLANDNPIIRTYFDNNISDDQLEQSARDFKHRVGMEIEHIYSTFTNIDTIKLNLLEVLTNDLLTHSKVSFENGQAMLDNVPIMPLENVPLYSKHPRVQELIAEITKLNDEFVDVSSLLSKSPDNDWLIKQKYALDEKRSRTSEQLRELERDLYALYKTTEKRRKSGKSMNWRERKALELMENGDAASARSILNDEQWKKDVDFAEEDIEQIINRIKGYLSGKKTEISIVKASGVTTETEQEITAIYEEITALAEKHKIELMTLYDYASFLYDQCKYPKGIKVAEILLKYLELDENTSDEDMAMLKNLLGNLCNFNNDRKKAEELHRESLEIYRRLTEANPSAYEPDVAMSCNNLASLLYNNEYEEAEKLYRESLEIWRRLTEKNPSAYEPFVAKSCNNLARLLANNNPKEAEKLYRESLEIRRRLAKKKPLVYEPDVAMICNNLAVLLYNNNNPKEAEKLYRKSLKIRRRLADTNPSAYEPDVAQSCFNYALLLYYYKNNKPAAKAYLEEALGYYEKFSHLEADAQQVRDILKKYF